MDLTTLIHICTLFLAIIYVNFLRYVCEYFFLKSVMLQTYCVKTRSTLRFGPRQLSAPLPQMPVLPTGFLTKREIHIRHNNMFLEISQSAY